MCGGGLREKERERERINAGIGGQLKPKRNENAAVVFGVLVGCLLDGMNAWLLIEQLEVEFKH